MYRSVFFYLSYSLVAVMLLLQLALIFWLEFVD